jgi:cystathionine beta-lyase
MYDFDKLTDRFGTLSYKWDVKPDELPMWVADMDFEVAPPIKKAITDRAEHGIFGYTMTPDTFFSAVSEYWARRHGYKIPTEHMVYSNGVVAAISSIVRKLTTPAENVLIQAPVYNIFYNSIINNGRNVLSSDLVYDGHGYSIDFEDLEEKLSRPQTSLMILCNPHNPVGRIWTKDELAKIGALCHKYGVTVLSDEIHCDITAPSTEGYIPFASVNKECRGISVTAVASSKTFNIAGLQSACLFAEDPVLRHKVWRGVNTDEVGEPNAFSMQANIAAFTECDAWVDEMLEYVFENKRIACDYINNEIKGMKANFSEATYLLWIDISGVAEDSVDFCEKLRESTGLYLSDGAEYGEPGRSFVRMNLAAPRARVLDGLERLKHGAEAYSGNNK